jgi:hypothetical protein
MLKILQVQTAGAESVAVGQGTGPCKRTHYELPVREAWLSSVESV